ncbi:hypothetical protein O181_128891 [Austropuccinia psidii MF-1]|uniref:Uncharacterized protein n=1 Tax=Austropuccinia psidii MF-1 TaxID=1389203 RepID=A0A9Q3Q840_9BASI|nr:hypothetical protein [Austropuccinia psidii MF-1]
MEQPPKINFCFENAQHPLIIDSGAHCSIVDRNYLDNHCPNWENQLFPTKAKNFNSASGKMTSIGTTIKEIINPIGKVTSHSTWSLLCLMMPTSKRVLWEQITRGLSPKDPLEELLKEFREGQFSTTLTSKQKLSLLKMMRKNRPAFAIGEEPLGKIRGHDIEVYLDVERPYPPMLRDLLTQQVWKPGRKLNSISMNSWTWMSSEGLDTMKYWISPLLS